MERRIEPSYDGFVGITGGVAARGPGKRIQTATALEEVETMAKDHGSSVKDDRLYEKLRKGGESKQKAARIANANAGGTNVSRKGGKGGSYEDRTKGELEQRAREIGIEGRSKMSKNELIDALRNH